MRKTYCGLVIASLLAATNASAADILTPSGSVNLGLTPKASTAPQTTAAPAHAKPAAPVTLPNLPAAAPTASSSVNTVPTPQIMPPPNFEPGGSISGDTSYNSATSQIDPNLKQQLKQSGINLDMSVPEDPEVTRLRAQVKQALRQQAGPTQFIDDAPDSSFAADNKTHHNNSLSFSMARNYFWGPSDVQQIMDTLNYTQQQIPNHCQLRLDAMLMADKSADMFRIYGGQQRTSRFDGTITRLMFTPKAVCDAPNGQLPVGGGVVLRSAGKYIVPLQRPGECKIPQAKLTSLSISYNGDGNMDCKFQ